MLDLDMLNIWCNETSAILFCADNTVYNLGKNKEKGSNWRRKSLLLIRICTHEMSRDTGVGPCSR